MTIEEKAYNYASKLVKNRLTASEVAAHYGREIEGISIGYGKPEWGAPTDRQVFIIKFKEGGDNETK